mmetsp:Transcript_321/g.775  ORF Transcript_321/g.775 Transcript_321/m.775 type:complete len:210 (+) Transcript_321:1019-1648(+)
MTNSVSFLLSHTRHSNKLVHIRLYFHSYDDNHHPSRRLSHRWLDVVLEIHTDRLQDMELVVKVVAVPLESCCHSMKIQQHEPNSVHGRIDKNGPSRNTNVLPLGNSIDISILSTVHVPTGYDKRFVFVVHNLGIIFHRLTTVLFVDYCYYLLRHVPSYLPHSLQFHRNMACHNDHIGRRHTFVFLLPTMTPSQHHPVPVPSEKFHSVPP